MRSNETCPTCGSTLGPRHEREALRRCEACQQPNPRGFRYCGFCATPLPGEEDAARVEPAPPPGGWPSLGRELVELRFFLDRGELDEAYELLSILHRRYPGHPALVEFDRGPASGQPRPDTHVHQVVDAVLAESASLSSSALPRRAVPQWNAPALDDGEDGKKTRAHATVPLGADDDEPTSRRPRPVVPKEPAPTRARTDKHLGAVPAGKGEAATAARQGRSGPTRAYGATPEERRGAAEKAARAGAPAGGRTVMVPTLQPAKPFEPPVDDRSRAPKKPDEGAARKRALEPKPVAPAKALAPKPAVPAKTAAPKKRTGKQAATPTEPEAGKKRTGKQAATPAEPEAGKKRARSHGARFGQNVLGRLGGKGKP